MADTLKPAFVIEAALFTSPQPMSVAELRKLFDGELSENEILANLNELTERWRSRGLMLAETARGWSFQSTPEVGPYLLRLTDQKVPKYSRAVLETLAIIAYRQPATRGDIEEIRGVALNPNIVRQLEERGWVEIIGHRESPGRPALFATTAQFLDDLGLKSISDLPPLSGDLPQAQEFELVFGDEKKKASGDAALLESQRMSLDLFDKEGNAAMQDSGAVTGADVKMPGEQDDSRDETKLQEQSIANDSTDDDA